MMNSMSVPNLAVLGMLGGAIDAAKVNTFADQKWIDLINKANSTGVRICVRLTLDPILKLIYERNVENERVLRVYADSLGPKLNVYAHDGVNFEQLVLVNMTVDLKPTEGCGIVTLHVFPANDPAYVYHGHMWFGDAQMAFNTVSNGMVEIHSTSIYTVPHMQARFGLDLISAYAHFLDGFTFVFASSEACIPGNSAFFRFQKGLWDSQTVSVTALGMEVESGDFYSIGGEYKPSCLVADETDRIALMYAFREGVGAFNLSHLTKTSSTENDPEKFAKACWRRILKMADEGLFTFVETQRGEFAVPTLKLRSSLK